MRSCLDLEVSTSPLKFYPHEFPKPQIFYCLTSNGDMKFMAIPKDDRVPQLLTAYSLPKRLPMWVDQYGPYVEMSWGRDIGFWVAVKEAPPFDYAPTPLKGIHTKQLLPTSWGKVIVNDEVNSPNRAIVLIYDRRN